MMKSPGWRKVIGMTIGKRVEFSTSLFYGAFNYSKIKAKVKKRGDKERTNSEEWKLEGDGDWLKKILNGQRSRSFSGKVIPFVDVLYRCFSPALIWNLRYNRATFAKCCFHITSVIISALEKDHVAILKELIHVRCFDAFCAVIFHDTIIYKLILCSA